MRALFGGTEPHTRTPRAYLPWTYRHLLIYVVYWGAVWFTDAHFMGDTLAYAQNIQAGSRALWDAGHLFWRPFGYVVWHVVHPFIGTQESGATVAGITFMLISINLGAGLLAVCSLHALLKQVIPQPRLVDGVTFGFIFAHGFLNYTQSGAAYVVALAALLFGLYLLVTKSRQAYGGPFAGVFAGVAFATSMCMWLPFALVIPAAIMAPICLFGHHDHRLKMAMSAAGTCCVLAAGAYFSAALYLQIDSLSNFLGWVAGASHGISIGGWMRMLLGFPRAFVNIGDDGILFKRFLVGDPYNPVAFGDLVRLSLWKISLFYVFLLSIVVNLGRTPQGRRVLGLFLLGSVPALTFAVYWQGGDMERYLAMYPFLFLSLAYALANWRLSCALKYGVMAYLALQIVTNAQAMSRARLTQVQERQVARVSPLLPLLKPQSVVFTLNQQDDLYELTHSFPFHPISQRYGDFTDNAIGLRWPHGFAEKTLGAWDAGGDIWISKRLLTPQPQPRWNWAEGSDQQPLWHNVYTFYTRLEQGPAIGDHDGFVQILPSAANKHVLRSILERRAWMYQPGARAAATKRDDHRLSAEFQGE